MFLSPVVVSLMLFIAGLLGVCGFYLIHALVDHLLAEAPANDASGDFSRFSE